MSAFHDSALIGAGGQGYQIQRSLRFNSPDSAYLNWTPGSAGSGTTWTWSGWVKRSTLTSNYKSLFGAGSNGTSTYDAIRFNTSDALEFFIANGATLNLATTQVFRDVSAWYHIVAVYNSSQATASNRAKLYVNGVEITSFSSSTYPSLSGASGGINANGIIHVVGASRTTVQTLYHDGYLTEINFIDGQALTPSSFGETDTITGVWKPKKYAGTYGTNGFYLNFSDNSGTTATTLGKDYSGNGNSFTPNNFSVTAGAGNDSLIDTPTPYADGGNGRGNYATLNALTNGGALANGNLDFSTGATHALSKSTFAIPASGLWYAEATVTSATSTTVAAGFGLGTSALSLTATASSAAGAWEIYSSDQRYFNRNGTQTSIAGTFAAGAVLQLAVDPANSRAWVGVNNTWYNGSNGTTGDPATGSNPTFTSLPAELFVIANTYSNTLSANFGQRAFAYTPPSGFLALNTQNLPTPTIKKPGTYMDVVTYTGTGSALTPTSSLGFSPDLVWIKGRSGATDHALYDTVRGVQLDLVSNSTAAETTQAQGLTAFSSNGFTVGTLAKLNTSTATYAAWCWDKSATPGFDIVTYTGTGVSGRTVSHGLGVSPSMIIVKNRTTAGAYWVVAHTSLSSGYITLLNTTDAQFLPGNGAYGGISAYNSTTFTVVTGTTSQLNVNTLNDIFVAYLWSEVAGFSKFGSYTGNGSSDGPFVYCGFRPRWVMVKRTDVANDWWIFDAARNDSNAVDKYLYADLSNAEATLAGYDFLSNGFKLRISNFNASGGTYIFAAFAESPFKYSLAR